MPRKQQKRFENLRDVPGLVVLGSLREEIQQADQAIVDELKQISEREVEMEDLRDHGEKDGGRGAVQGVEDLRMKKEARRAHLREQVIGMLVSGSSMAGR
ncbi:hypothetical protein NL676_007661 [Syzygium grande]|nr:hypothetical protein NL676_007661 [Syzygium grande]